MTSTALSRREMIKGSMAFAALALSQYPFTSLAESEAEEGVELIPFLDKQPPARWCNGKS
jgi:secreted PhoX family phosphatase